MDKFELLVKGNTLAKTWARKILGRRKLAKFLTALISRKGVTSAQLEEIFSIPLDQREAILATQEVVHEIFMQFDKMAIRIARRYATGVGRYNEADIQQLESESRVGLLKAIRGYARLEIKFITYAYRACCNEVSRYLQRCMGIGLTGIDVSLLVKYKKKVEELVKASLPHSFEDICDTLQLTKKQISRLKDAMLAEVKSESEMETNLAAVILDSHKDTKLDLEFIKQLEKVNLTVIEKYAFISKNNDIRALFPDAFSSSKDVALHFDVSPQAVDEAFKRARRKLERAFSKWN